MKNIIKGKRVQSYFVTFLNYYNCLIKNLINKKSYNKTYMKKITMM